MSTTPPTRIGKYDVTGVLGRGGMGVVYRASDKHLGREVAIKTITEGFAGSPEMLQRFYQEAAKTGKLNHPNIVTVYNLGEQEGFPYIVMEYVEGAALNQLIHAARPLSLVSGLHVIEQVCSALAYAHRNDVIHRDVKPANVIVQPDGVAKLLDFGIASQQKQERGLTRVGTVVGTIDYMAPERLRDHAFDGRSDIFSAGIMLYQLLTGRLPFTGEGFTLMQKLLNERHPPLSNFLHDYPVALETIIDRALAKEPDARYGSADEMAADIHAVAEEVRKGQVLELFQQAQLLVQGQEYTKARQILLRVTKLDRQHTAARRLLVEVQHDLALRQRGERAKELKFRAQAALDEKQFDLALSLLEEALRFDPSSELTEKLESVRHKKLIRESIEEYLQRADDERSRGNLEVAQAIVAKALDLDKEDSRVRAAHIAVVQQVKEAARLTKALELLESARGEMASRNFTAATKLLNDVEQINPGNPELILLLKQAKSGHEQERRRRVIEQLQNELTIATTHEQLTNAAVRVIQALDWMPDEPSLLKLKGQLDRQIRDSEARREVDETVQHCRVLLDSSPEDALRLVQDKLRKFPGNEQLLVLHSGVEEHIANATLQEARTHYLAQAHEAINGRQYWQAVRLLETCQADGIFSDEITELLEFARHEAAQQHRESLVEASFAQAQAFIKKGDYRAVIDLLEPVVEQTNDVSMRALLDKARNQERAWQEKIDTVLESAEDLVRSELFDEALSFLESQTESVSRSARLTERIQVWREMRDREIALIQVVGSAYGALDNLDIDGGWATLQTGLQANPQSPVLKRVQNTFQSRCRVTAEQALSSAVGQARAALEAGDPRSAVDLLGSVSALVGYAALDLQTEWQQLRKKASRAKMLARVGIRPMRSGTAWTNSQG